MASSAFIQSSRQWPDKRFVWTGGLSGVLGGLCCVAGALAMATGLSALSFLTTWQDRYGPYFITGSIVLMLAWLARQTASYGWTRPGLRHASRVIGRQALIMGAIYGVTLALTFAAMGVAEAA